MATVESLLDESYQQRLGKDVQTKWRYFWLLLLAVSLPMMLPYLSNLWVREQYRYFPFVLLAVGWFVAARWDREFVAPRGRTSWLAISLGFACVAAGIFLPSMWLAAVGFVTFATAFLISIKGPADKTLFAVAVPLLLLLHLPLGYDHLLIIQLQRITTGLSSLLLDGLAVPHAVSNNVIQLATRELFVAEACSGIQSVFTLTFIATVLVVAYRRSIWLTPIYVLISILLAVAANVVRVSAVAVGDVWFSVDLALGWQHELVGYVALIISVLLLLSFDQLVIGLLHPIDPRGDSTDRNPLITLWNHVVSDQARTKGEHRANHYHSHEADDEADSITESYLAKVWQVTWLRRVFISVASVLALSSFIQMINLQRRVDVSEPSTEVVFVPPSDVFDDEYGSIHITSHEVMRGASDPRLGENADIWHFEINDLDVEAQIVLSQPYTGWHELCVCYEAADWTMVHRDVQGSKDGSIDDQPYQPLALARFKRQQGQYAYLLYSGFDPAGDVLMPPARPGKLGARFLDFSHTGDEYVRPNVLMLQMFVVVPHKLDPAVIRSLAADFVQLRSDLLDRLRAE